MGRCTAVEILELDDKPTNISPEAFLHDEQRLSLLEEVWGALTEVERRLISDRLDAKQHGQYGGEGRMGGGNLLRPKHVDDGDWGDVGTEAGS